ncbi:Protein of uncharacterised function (DUF763) [Chryseobacterium carnipullorum]|uniref:Protein of uncharacterized function (DUF763) n=2 Tax=Chryseobacterium carnipullorum TaxID=1124835 RepID=A0A376DUQ6_CHRCU|nr:Protein of uncharacterised function (DUF763) [Chryseobacterium carnipullorum]
MVKMKSFGDWQIRSGFRALEPSWEWIGIHPGITTSVMGALKRSINPNSQSLGLYICGGKGKFSRETPSELLQIADKTGLNGHELVRASKLSAKVDNTAIQDGYQLYLHNFILADNGSWSVVQQGMP